MRPFSPKVLSFHPFLEKYFFLQTLQTPRGPNMPHDNSGLMCPAYELLNNLK